MSGKVFFAVLNLGLGHATRSLPIIREFVRRKWEVLIGSNGRALALLKNEVPEAQFVETPSYELTYAKNDSTSFALFLQSPKFLRGIRDEHAFCEYIVSRFQPNLIISDQCYGIHHRRVISFLISHQIYFEMPSGFGVARKTVGRFNRHYYEKFSKIIIPDFPDGDGGLLSGRLSEVPDMRHKYVFAGLFSSVRKTEVPLEIDVLVSISGPEPQRTIFEEKVLREVERIPGKKVVLLGKSESQEVLTDRDDLKVYSHMPREKMADLMNKSGLIVSRSGYSTLMELVELGKPALFVPTPGQTEQIYLSKRMQEKRWFYSVPQKELSLRRDVEIARDYAGLFKPKVTQWTINRLFDKVFRLNAQQEVVHSR